MTLWVIGGEPAIRAAVMAAASEVGVDAKEPDVALLSPQTEDALVDLGVPPAEWTNDLEGDERGWVAALVPSADKYRRVIRLSMLGAGPQASSEIQRAHAAAEDAWSASSTKVVNLRAGVILGDCGLTGAFCRAAKRFRIVPIPGCAGSRFEPIALEDVGRYVVEAAQTDRELDDIYDLGCGEMMNGTVYVRSLGETMGFERWCVPLPLMAGGIFAALHANEDFPASAVRAWLDMLSGGLMPRRVNAWEHFSIRPINSREATAAAVGLAVPRRREEEEERFEGWNRNRSKSKTWIPRR